jgi:hypothetical protein
MDGRTTSNRELARRIGVSETAVRRAEKAGRIKREADGSWDPAKVKAAWSDNTDQTQQRGDPSAGNESRRAARRAVKPVPETALGAVRDTLREHGEPVSAGGMTFMQARTANEVLKAQERRVRLQRMKGELVDRGGAERGHDKARVRPLGQMLRLGYHAPRPTPAVERTPEEVGEPARRAAHGQALGLGGGEILGDRADQALVAGEPEDVIDGLRLAPNHQLVPGKA